MIQELRIHALRNIQQASLELQQCNLFIGKNGSGKTSLLEAVFLLSRGKAFAIMNLSVILHITPRLVLSGQGLTIRRWLFRNSLMQQILPPQL